MTGNPFKENDVILLMEVVEAKIMEVNLEFGPDVASTRSEEGIIKVRCKDDRTASWIKEIVKRMEQGFVTLSPGDTSPRRNFSIENPNVGSPRKRMVQLVD